MDACSSASKNKKRGKKGAPQVAGRGVLAGALHDLVEGTQLVVVLASGCNKALTVQVLERTVGTCRQTAEEKKTDDARRQRA